MKKRTLIATALGIAAVLSIALVACGGGGSSSGGEGKEGGTLNITYASSPEAMDPALAYSAEGWTAMGEVYIPLLTYKHAEGVEGSEVVPGLAKEMPRSQQRRQDLHPRPPARPQVLRRQAGQGLRLHLHGRTAAQAQLPRLALLHQHRRRRKVRRNQKGRHPRDQDRRQDRRNHDRAGTAPGNLRQRAGDAVRRPGARRDPGRRPLRQPAAGDRPVHDHQVPAGPRLGIRPQPLLGQSQLGGDAGLPLRPRRRRQGDGHPQRADPGQRRRTEQVPVDGEPGPAEQPARRSKKSSKGPSCGCRRRTAPTSSG